MQDPEFINRKTDHLRLALSDDTEATGLSMLDRVELTHDSMPEFNLEEVELRTHFFGEPIATPFFIAGMTGGFPDADRINEILASLAAERGWAFGVGSQRREVESLELNASILKLKANYPNLKLIANIGISQLIKFNQRDRFAKLFEMLEQMKASALAIHLNPLQEAIQEEGTPQFKGSMDSLSVLKDSIKIPLILKETGSGVSASFLRRIKDLELSAVDVSGLGGTHWGRIEGKRATDESIASGLGETFKKWGVSTAHSILNSVEVLQDTQTEIWASGGVRTGLDAAKCFALGAQRAGFAKPALQAALSGERALERWMRLKEAELRTALFCTNSRTLSELNVGKIEGNL